MHPVPVGETGGSKRQGQGSRRGIARSARSAAKEDGGYRLNWRHRREPLPAARGDPLALLLGQDLAAAQRPPLQAGVP